METGGKVLETSTCFPPEKSKIIEQYVDGGVDQGK